MTKSLQTEIRQTRSFAHRDVEALASVLRTATVLEHAHNEVLRPLGITFTQFNVLRILQGAGRDGLCGREVGERLISNVPDVSRLVDRMDDMQLLTRERDASDRRHVTARITPRGRRLLTEANPLLEALARSRFQSLGSGTLRTLVTALAEVRQRT